MPAVTKKVKHNDMLREIFGTLNQWSELERTVFSRAHYNGQSPEAISRSFKLDVNEVKAILRQCDRRLYDSLRKFRKSSCEKPSCIHARAAEIAAQGLDLKTGHRLSSKEYKNLSTSQIAV